jgi:hypothetical protein
MKKKTKKIFIPILKTIVEWKEVCDKKENLNC